MSALTYILLVGYEPGRRKIKEANEKGIDIIDLGILNALLTGVTTLEDALNASDHVEFIYEPPVPWTKEELESIAGMYLTPIILSLYICHTHTHTYIHTYLYSQILNFQMYQVLYQHPNLLGLLTFHPLQRTGVGARI